MRLAPTSRPSRIAAIRLPSLNNRVDSVASEMPCAAA